MLKLAAQGKCWISESNANQNPLVQGSSPGGHTGNENTNLGVGIFLVCRLHNTTVLDAERQQSTAYS
jgi:hypothetical protein